MKKILTITATCLVALLPLILVFKTTFAEKNIFGGKTQDDLENAKQISLAYLQSEALNRGIVNAADFKVEKVEIDDL